MVKNVIYQTIIHGCETRGKSALADVICYCKMTQVMALDGVASFLHLKDITNTSKRMWHSPTIGRSSSVQWRKVGRSWTDKDIICVSSFIVCENRNRLALMRELLSYNSMFVGQLYEDKSLRLHACDLISLQLISKQWIITQQITARVDLFLNYKIPNWYINSTGIALLINRFVQVESWLLKGCGTGFFFKSFG